MCLSAWDNAENCVIECWRAAVVRAHFSQTTLESTNVRLHQCLSLNNFWTTSAFRLPSTWDRMSARAALFSTLMKLRDSRCYWVSKIASSTAKTNSFQFLQNKTKMRSQTRYLGWLWYQRGIRQNASVSLDEKSNERTLRRKSTFPVVLNLTAVSEEKMKCLRDLVCEFRFNRENKRLRFFLLL